MKYVRYALMGIGVLTIIGSLAWVVFSAYLSYILGSQG